jgi:hypothetical protein
MCLALLLIACHSPMATSNKTGPANRLSPVELLQVIARDIEVLKWQFPQLEDFEAKKHLDPARLVIEYERHTHAATHQGGWTSGVPNPDADGIWLYIDLHDPASTAQIHTQPDVPMLDVRGRKLMMLILEGDATTRVAGELRALLERRAGGLVTIDDLLLLKPSSGLFTVDGWAEIIDAREVWFSPVRGAFKDPMTREQNLVLRVPDVRGFSLMKKYRVTVEARCGGAFELRSYRALPDP